MAVEATAIKRMFVLLIVMLAHVLGSHQFCSHSNLHIIQLDVYGTENMQSHPASHTYNPLPIDHPPTPTEIHCIALRVWSMLCPNSISILLCRPVLTLMWCFSAFICGKSQQTNERSQRMNEANKKRESTTRKKSLKTRCHPCDPQWCVYRSHFGERGLE